MADVQMIINVPEDMMKWVNNPNCPPDYGVGDFMDIIRQGKLIPIKKDGSLRAERMTDDDIAMCCAEVDMSGAIGFCTTCRATARRYVKRMNDWFKENYYDWQVELVVDKGLRFPYSARVARASNDIPK